MQDRHVPYLAPHYWIVLSIASIAGANMGDFVAEYLGIGHVRGLPVLAIGLAAILFAESRDFSLHTTWYWLAVVVIRTGATNLADFLTTDGRQYLPRLDIEPGQSAALDPAARPQGRSAAGRGRRRARL